MSGYDHEQFNKLLARVVVQERALVALCRHAFSADDITALLAPVDRGVAREQPEFARSVDQALADFRREVLLPDIGSRQSREV